MECADDGARFAAAPRHSKRGTGFIPWPLTLTV